MFESISVFFGNIRFADLLDIAIVSIFLYIFLSWLRRSASKRIIITIFGFLVLYLLSRIFDMYLTEILIKVLIVIIILASIIFFQSDIRRLIDMIGQFVLFNRKSVTATTPTVDIITQAVIHMAEKRIGALIAVKGREPWDRPVHGGIELNGSISQPLLYSIFNVNSPGHDGAVLIEGDNIFKFGAHLDLSKNLSEVGQGGTRHAAALGLSEQSDAFILVVSEERGTISIASGGKLNRVTSGSELKNRLGKFWEKHYSDQNYTPTEWWKRKSFVTAASALIISTALWFAFAYQSEIVYRTFMVPIEFRNIRSDLGLKDPSPIQTRITLSGSDQAFRLLDPATLAVSIDLKKLKEGQNAIVISEDNLDLPSKINLYEVDPKAIKVEAYPLKTIQVPVAVKTVGKIPAKNFKITTEPESLKVLVSEKAGNPPGKIFTEAVDLSSISESTTLNGKLIPPANARLLPDQSLDVKININLKQK